MDQLKQNSMEKLNREYTDFFAKIYSDQNKVMVYGEGNLDASLALVGETPGRHETVKGRPFVGQAGKILDEFIKILELNRDELYITSVVKFRPFNVNPDTGKTSNRPPNKEEIELNKSWLFEELHIVEPSTIVSLGNIALQTLSGDSSLTIGKVHGTPMKVEVGDKKLSTILFPLYHPASIIYRRKLKEVYLEDLRKLKNYLKAP